MIDPKKSNRGFSLLELMVAVTVFTVLAAGMMGMLYQSQWAFQTQGSLNRSAGQARIAMDQMVRYLRHAGNDPTDYMKDSDIPAAEILGTNHIRVNSDITGSVDSTTENTMEATGDPDGNLASIHEQVVFRYDDQADQLLVDIGYGESVLADNIADFQLQFFDVSGNETSDSNEVSRIQIRLVAETPEVDPNSGQPNRLVLHSEVFIRSKVFNPFKDTGTAGAASSPSDPEPPVIIVPQ